jgi:ankyrin repeat protein
MQSHSEFFNRVYRLGQEEPPPQLSGKADRAFSPEDYLWDRFTYESTYRGLTPLMIASLTGEIYIANELMTDPSSLYDISCIGDTALMCAAAEGHTNIVKLLLDADAKQKDLSRLHDVSALEIEACDETFGHGLQQVLEEIYSETLKDMKYMSYIMELSDDELTKLHLKLREDLAEKMTIRRKSRSDGDLLRESLIKLENSVTDQEYQMKPEQEPRISTLQVGIDHAEQTVQEKTEEGIQLVAQMRIVNRWYKADEETSAGFIDMRNDPFLEDNGGNTALMLAHMGGHQETAELLLSAGADGTIKNNSGRDAMIAVIKYDRRLAATKLQSNVRGRQFRARNKSYEKWRGIMAHDIGLAEEVDICDWLQKDVHNFVLRLPGSTNYEAWNMIDITNMNRVEEVKSEVAYNFFHGCKEKDENNWQHPPEEGKESNIITDTSYLKLSSCNLVTMWPGWQGQVPEPRVFHFVYKKQVNALVSIPLLNHYGEMMEYAWENFRREIEEFISSSQARGSSAEEIEEQVEQMSFRDSPLQSADHCNHLEPVKIYELIGDNEPVIAGADGQGGGSSMKSYRKKKSKKKSKKKKRKKRKKRTKRTKRKDSQ